MILEILYRRKLKVRVYKFRHKFFCSYTQLHFFFKHSLEFLQVLKAIHFQHLKPYYIMIYYNINLIVYIIIVLSCILKFNKRYGNYLYKTLKDYLKKS